MIVIVAANKSRFRPAKVIEGFAENHFFLRWLHIEQLNEVIRVLRLIALVLTLLIKLIFFLSVLCAYRLLVLKEVERFALRAVQLFAKEALIRLILRLRLLLSARLHVWKHQSMRQVLRQEDMRQISNQIGVNAHLNQGRMTRQNVNQFDTHGFHVERRIVPAQIQQDR